MTRKRTLLGFILHPESNESSPSFDNSAALALPKDLNDFPDKIGGTPFWLHPSAPLPSSSVICPSCQCPMILLTQFYTFSNLNPFAHHRVVYVFTCPKGSCHLSAPSLHSCFKVFRSQISKEESSKICKLSFSNSLYCRLCGLQGSQQCSKCHVAKYCSKSHQILDWKLLGHKKDCSTTEEDEQTLVDPTISHDSNNSFRNLKLLNSMTQSHLLFPEYELTLEMEQSQSRNQKSNDFVPKDAENLQHQSLVNQFIKKNQNVTGDIRTLNLNEYSELSQGSTLEDEEGELDGLDDERLSALNDPVFLEFQKTVDLDPEQIIRYIRPSEEYDYYSEEEEEESLEHDSEDDSDSISVGSSTQQELMSTDYEALWVSDKGRPSATDIPHCPHCGTERTCEFQIMPQILNHLKIDHSSPESLDFGTLLVYTCPNQCSIPSTSSVSDKTAVYAEEIIWRQDFSI